MRLTLLEVQSVHYVVLVSSALHALLGLAHS